MSDAPTLSASTPDAALARAILSSMQSRIAVVDSTGTIVAINDSWSRFAMENGDPDLVHAGLGVNYLDVTQRSAQAGDTLAAEAHQGMIDVLEGKRQRFEQRYPCHSPTQESWFLMRVTPLRSDRIQGVVISHIDITVQHLAERARARRERKRQTVRRQEREFAAIESASRRMAATETETTLQDLEQQYDHLLEKAFEQRLFKVDHELQAQARALAVALGKQTAGPRDIIAMHTRTLEAVRARGYTPARMQVYLEEGRLLLLEIMGYLAAYYRDMLFAALEQQSI